jgi:DNA-binding winged helix-turn-helix (wHTH) protein
MSGAIETPGNLVQGHQHGVLGAHRSARVAVSDGRWMLGDWLVNPSAHRIERAGDVVALEPRMMAVLVELSRRPGGVVSADALLRACWPGEVLGDNPLQKVIAGLRRALGDSPTTARYIETIRKQG